MQQPITGTPETKQFYNRTGWRERRGKTVDGDLVGVKEDGPIRIELDRLHVGRARAALAGVGEPLSLLECGCGGSPATVLLDLCSSYTGVDFSSRGLELAGTQLAAAGVPYELLEADACNLPFDDNTFDAVYSANMIYHIADWRAQRTALDQLLRVTRPGGVLILIAANPHPLLFPARLIRRLLAEAPLIGPLLNRIRRKPPLPYHPMPLHWMRRVLSRWGPVQIVSAGLPSTAFSQRVTEYRGMGRILWKLIRRLDRSFPRASAWLGNYVQITVTKTAVAAEFQCSGAGAVWLGSERDHSAGDPAGVPACTRLPV